MKLKFPIKDKVFENVNSFLGKRSETQNKESIVFTNGCFDILHIGHVDYLERASRKADFMVVGLNSDDSVSRLKGEGRPLNKWINRAQMLAALSFVDAVVKFEEDTPLRIIESILPDILIKGSDYEIADIVGANEVIKNGGSVETIDFVHDISTSKIIEKLK